jgi:hypothetical protein
MAQIHSSMIDDVYHAVDPLTLTATACDSHSGGSAEEEITADQPARSRRRRAPARELERGS